MIDWDPRRYLGFDFETSGVLPEYALQPWRVAQKLRLDRAAFPARTKAWATSLVWMRGDYLDQPKGGLNPNINMMADMLDVAIKEKRRIVGWNVQFDIQWLLAYGLEDLVFQCKWLDGMLLWRHATIEPEYQVDRPEKKYYGLKDYVKELHSGKAGYEEGIDFHNPDPTVRARLHVYNIKDVEFTLDGAEHWWRCLTNHQQSAALIEAECLPVVALANLKGLVVDTIAAHDLQQSLSDTAKLCLTKLGSLGVDEKVVRSPKKLSAVLFDNWKLPSLKQTGTNQRSTDKEVLHELALGGDGRPPDPRVKCIKEYREALGNRAKFADAVLESATYNEDGCTHPQAYVFGTYTGRMTYSSKQGTGKDERQIGFAIHQEKSIKKKGDEMFRLTIGTPPGFTLMEFDAAGQEYRWMAIASGDETMLHLCQPGEDPHSFMAASIYKLDYHDIIKGYKAGEVEKKRIRDMGKFGNLSCQYRISARRLLVRGRVEYNIPMEMKEAQLIHDTYPKTYKRVPRYWDFQIAKTKSTGYVETFAGRRVNVVGDWTGTFGWSMASTSINYRIQGTGADQKYLALAVVKPYIRKIGARFAFDMHDGLYFYVPNVKVREAGVKIKDMLDHLPYKLAWSFEPPIPLPWDVKAGGSWGDFHEVKI